MESNNEIQENFSEEVDLKFSIEDFLRELEEKEKDLNMSEEMVIEIDEDSFGTGTSRICKNRDFRRQRICGRYPEYSTFFPNLFRRSTDSLRTVESDCRSRK